MCIHTNYRTVLCSISARQFSNETFLQHWHWKCKFDLLIWYLQCVKLCKTDRKFKKKNKNSLNLIFDTFYFDLLLVRQRSNIQILNISMRKCVPLAMKKAAQLVQISEPNVFDGITVRGLRRPYHLNNLIFGLSLVTQTTLVFYLSIIPNLDCHYRKTYWLLAKELTYKVRTFALRLGCRWRPSIFQIPSNKKHLKHEPFVGVSNEVIVHLTQWQTWIFFGKYNDALIFLRRVCSIGLHIWLVIDIVFAFILPYRMLHEPFSVLEVFSSGCDR